MKLPKFNPIWLLLGFPVGLILTVIYYGEPADPRTPSGLLRELPTFILMAMCVLWTWLYGAVGNYQHFAELRLRLRRKIGNYNKATWTAWVVVNLIQPILTIGYVVWYFKRFF